MARRGVDGGVARAARRRPTWDDGGEGQRGREDERTRRRGVLTGASDGVQRGVGDDGGVACSDTRSAAREARRAVGLSGRRCRNTDTETGAWQPRGDGVLTGGPGAERERLTGGSPVSAIF
jgi:hypothetical protein